MFARPAMAVAALAVLFASLTNAHAHVHLCLDGQDLPASVHGVHDGDHAHHGEEQGSHDDLDVDLRDQGLAKSYKPDLPALTLAVGWLLPAGIDVAAHPNPDPGAARGTDPPHTRPFLRAPPTLLR
jgi:hypothetical protein